LVGFLDKLIVWAEQAENQLFVVLTDCVQSIKRLLAYTTFVIKTQKEGVKLLTIKDIKSQEYSIKGLLEVEEDGGN
jgi:hypothetical protein